MKDEKGHLEKSQEPSCLCGETRMNTDQQIRNEGLVCIS